MHTKLGTLIVYIIILHYHDEENHSTVHYIKPCCFLWSYSINNNKKTTYLKHFCAEYISDFCICFCLFSRTSCYARATALPPDEYLLYSLWLRLVSTSLITTSIPGNALPDPGWDGCGVRGRIYSIYLAIQVGAVNIPVFLANIFSQCPLILTFEPSQSVTFTWFIM
jgi:hypothetical protein